MIEQAIFNKKYTLSTPDRYQAMVSVRQALSTTELNLEIVPPVFFDLNWLEYS